MRTVWVRVEVQDLGICNKEDTSGMQIVEVIIELGDRVW